MSSKVKSIKSIHQLKKRLKVLANRAKAYNLKRRIAFSLFNGTYQLSMTRCFLPVNPRIIKNFSMLRYSPNQIRGARKGN